MPRHYKDKKSQYSGKTHQHIKIYYGMMQHPNFMALSGAALKVLFFLITKHNGFNNGRIACSYECMSKELRIGKATAKRACDDLKYYGFLKRKKKGAFYGRKANEWELTFVPSEGYQPTNDWKEAKPRLRGRPKKEKTMIEEIVEMAEDENLKTGTTMEHKSL